MHVAGAHRNIIVVVVWFVHLRYLLELRQLAQSDTTNAQLAGHHIRDKPRSVLLDQIDFALVRDPDVTRIWGNGGIDGACRPGCPRMPLPP